MWVKLFFKNTAPHDSPPHLSPQLKERGPRVFKQRLDTHTLHYANRYSVSLSCPLKEKPNMAVCGAPIFITPSLRIQIWTVGK